MVSVILTAKGNDLPTALRSALRQTHRQMEVLLAADAATCATAAEQANDARVSLVPIRSGVSAAAARNAALACARGETVAYLSADCAWYPYHLECLLEAMADAPDRLAAVSRLYHVRRRGRTALEKKLPPAPTPVREAVLAAPCVEISSLCHRAELSARAGKFDAALPDAAADWDFARRLAFQTDFASIEDITGELTVPAEPGKGDAFSRYAEIVRRKRPPRPSNGTEKISVESAPARPDSPEEVLSLASRHETEGNWRRAAELYQQLLVTAEAKSDLEHLTAQAMYRGGDHGQAMELCRGVNERRPTVDSLLLEAWLHRNSDNDEAALEALQQAEQILSWKG